jgi:methionine aminopeptidase
MDRTNRIVVEILELMRDMVKPGATTAQINAMAEEELAKRGAKSPFKGYAPMGLPPYPAVVCSSVNDVIVHGIPNRARCRKATSSDSTSGRSSRASSATRRSRCRSARSLRRRSC